MKRIFSDFPPGPVIVAGSDIPGITPGSIEKAFRALQDADAVFGPSPDGGFWLVGLKRVRKTPPSIFENVRWSSEHALKDSLSTIPGWEIAYADTLDDMDLAEDIERAAYRGKLIGNWI